MIDPNRIDLSKLAEELGRFENQWVAISEENRILASGTSYQEVVNALPRPDAVVLLKVPPQDASLAPAGQ
jgi:hypothetical protein